MQIGVCGGRRGVIRGSRFVVSAGGPGTRDPLPSAGNTSTPLAERLHDHGPCVLEWRTGTPCRTPTQASSTPRARVRQDTPGTPRTLRLPNSVRWQVVTPSSCPVPPPDSPLSPAVLGRVSPCRTSEEISGRDRIPHPRETLGVPHSGSETQLSPSGPPPSQRDPRLQAGDVRSLPDFTGGRGVPRTLTG